MSCVVRTPELVCRKKKSFLNACHLGKILDMYIQPNEALHKQCVVKKGRLLGEQMSTSSYTQHSKAL